MMICSLAGLTFAAGDANASGWGLNDQSVTGLGRAYSDGALAGDDYSAIAYNPAAMQLGGSGVQLGGTLINLRSDVKGTYHRADGARTGDANVNVSVLVPNFFAQYKVNEKMRVGFGIYVPFGLAIKYDSNWFASDHGITSDLQVIDFAPAVSYEVMDNLSLGVAVNFRKSSVFLTSTQYAPTTALDGTRNEFDLEDWGVGLNVGAMYKLGENTRFGVSFRSRSQHQIKGSTKLTGGLYPYGDAYPTTTLPMDAPERVLANVYHRIGDFGLSAGVEWTRWSRFDALRLNNASKSAEVGQRWKNTWRGAVGLDYYHSENWTFRGGIGFDESPVPNSEWRTAAIADNDRWMFSVGTSYKTGAWTVDFGYSFLYLPTYEVHNRRQNLAGVTSVPQLDAKYDTYAHVVGLQVQYTF